MTEAASSIAALRNEQLDYEDLAIADLHRQNTLLRAELDEVEPVISASLLVATAFRLRDQNALVSALRLLVRAIRLFEDRRACA
jgi:predicted alpha/beta hydrolase